MNDSRGSESMSLLSSADSERLRRWVLRFEQALEASQPFPIEDALFDTLEPLRSALCIELLEREWRWHLQQGRPIPWSTDHDRFPFLTAAAWDRLRQIRSDPPYHVPMAGTKKDSPGQQASSEKADEALANTEWSDPEQLPRPLSTNTSALSRPVGEKGRFRVARLHALGGLGQVSLALDEQLGREVALKEIQAQHAEDLECRARFVREAEITGHLEHPGIVPVYAFGQDTEGRPFYAMRFIRGQSLKEAVDSFHREHGQWNSSPESELAFRQLLGRFIAVCQTVDFAHSRKVVHRDLKPANVMLGPFGETLVVDWGLAKTLGGTAEEVLQVQGPWESPTEIQGTLAGSLLGTPGFMSPEQAWRRHEQVGPAADIYSLGATLYYLLTGRSPVEGMGLGEALERTQQGRIDPPHVLRPQLPQPVEAICLRAMGREPADRYPSAGEMAKDLENWLADQPVTAYRESLLERSRRWTRRHRPLVASGVALLAVATVLLAISTFLIGMAQRETDAARQEALASFEEARRKSELLTMSNISESEARRLAQANARHAEQNMQLARQRADALERQVYAHRIGLAHRDWLRGKAHMVRRHLNACPPHLRHWEWHYLDRLLHGPLITIAAHGSHPIKRVALRPDGELAVTLGAEHTRADWDTWTGQLVRRVDGFPGALQVAAFSRDGRWLALSMDDGAVIWNRPEETRATGNFALGGSILAMSFHPNEDRLAVAGKKGEIYMLSFDPESPIRSFKGHSGSIIDLHFSPSGDRLLTLGQDGFLRLWNSDMMELVREVAPTDGTPRQAVFSPCGTMLLWADDEGRIHAWSADLGREILAWSAHVGPITRLAFAPDGSQLVSTGRDRMVHVWETASGQLRRTYRGHAGPVEDVAWSAQGDRLVTVSQDGMLRIWDARSVPDYLDLESESRLRAIAWDHGSNRLALVDEERGVRVFDWPIAQPRFFVRAGGRELRGAYFSPDGAELFGVADDQAPRWSTRTGASNGTGPATLMASTSEAFAENGAIAARSQMDFSIRLTVRGTTASLVGHRGWINRLVFSPDATLLASASEDQIIRVWSVASPEAEPLKLEGHQASVRDLAFSLDGRRLFSSGKDGLIKVWDIDTGLELLSLECGGEADSLALCPRGNSLAVVVGKHARVWDGTPVACPSESLARFLVRANLSQFLPIVEEPIELAHPDALGSDSLALATDWLEKMRASREVWSELAWQQVVEATASRADYERARQIALLLRQGKRNGPEAEARLRRTLLLSALRLERWSEARSLDEDPAGGGSVRKPMDWLLTWLFQVRSGSAWDVSDPWPEEAVASVLASSEDAVVRLRGELAEDLARRSSERANAPRREAALRLALRLTPRNPRLWRLRAEWFAERKQWERVVADLAESLRLAPNDPVALRLRAHAFAMQGAWGQASEDWDRLGKLGPLSLLAVVRHAALRLGAEDREGFQRLRNALLARPTQGMDRTLRVAIALLATLDTVPPPHPQVVVALARGTIEDTPRPDSVTLVGSTVLAAALAQREAKEDAIVAIDDARRRLKEVDPEDRELAGWTTILGLWLDLIEWRVDVTRIGSPADEQFAEHLASLKAAPPSLGGTWESRLALELLEREWRRLRRDRFAPTVP